MMYNRRVWYLANLFLAILLVLSLRIVYWQLVFGAGWQTSGPDPVAEAVGATAPDEALDAFAFLKGEQLAASIQQMPQPLVQRLSEQLANLQRGSIYDRRGHLLAYENLERVRVYPEPAFAPVIGYVSGLRNGISGLEAHYNRTLFGLDRLDAQAQEALRQEVVGSDLVLTMDTQVQQLAESALGGRPGAAVVLNARTGAVLAMVSTPHFDPNQVLNPEYINSLLANCASDDCRAPFLNRATQSHYTPGSTWKTLTLIAALDSGQVTPETVFDFGEPRQGPNGIYYVYEVGGGVIPDPNHTESQLTLPMAYAKSANAAFARMGAEMPPETFIDYARRFGFGAPGEVDFGLEIEYTPSQAAGELLSLETNDLLRAATSIGQGELLVNPLNMAMVAAAVVNQGDMPVPYFVEQVRTPLGLPLPGPNRGEVIRNTMSAWTADQVREIMITSVVSGSGRGAALPGIAVGGKTGTAQLGGEDNPHAWFIGFADDGRNAVAISVVLENAGSGYANAVPVFAQLAPAALQALDGDIDFQPEPAPDLPAEQP